MIVTQERQLVRVGLAVFGGRSILNVCIKPPRLSNEQRRIGSNLIAECIRHVHRQWVGPGRKGRGDDRVEPEKPGNPRPETQNHNGPNASNIKNPRHFRGLGFVSLCVVR